MLVVLARAYFSSPIACPLEQRIHEQVVADDAVDVVHPEMGAQMIDRERSQLGRHLTERRPQSCGLGADRQALQLDIVKWVSGGRRRFAANCCLFVTNYVKDVDPFPPFAGWVFEHSEVIPRIVQMSSSFDMNFGSPCRDRNDGVVAVHPIVAQHGVGSLFAQVLRYSWGRVSCLGTYSDDAMIEEIDRHDVEIQIPGFYRFNFPIDRTKVFERAHCSELVFRAEVLQSDGVAELGSGVPDHVESLAFVVSFEYGCAGAGSGREFDSSTCYEEFFFKPMETDGFGQHVEDDRLRLLVRPRDVPVDSEALGTTRVDEVEPPFVFQEIVPVDVFERKHDASVCGDYVSGRIGRKDVIG